MQWTQKISSHIFIDMIDGTVSIGPYVGDFDPGISTVVWA